MAYRCANLRDIPEGVQQFRTLRRLLVDNGPENPIAYDARLCSTLASLADLEELQISIGPAGDPDTRAPLLALPNLQIFRVTISQSLTLRWRLPSLHTLFFTVMAGGLNYRRLFLISLVPHLQHFHLRLMMQSRLDSEKLSIEDMESFLAHTSKLKTFQLDDVPHQLTPEDLASALKSWRQLRTLSINWAGELISSSVLLSISKHPQLRSITLPLDFTFLTDPLPTSTRQSRCHLTELRCCRWTGIPTKGAKKIVVLRNLLRLFPNLSRIVSEYDGEGLLEELQELIASFRELLANRV